MVTADQICLVILLPSGLDGEFGSYLVAGCFCLFHPKTQSGAFRLSVQSSDRLSLKKSLDRHPFLLSRDAACPVELLCHYVSIRSSHLCNNF